MIKHFIKWDFKQHRGGWLCLILITLIAAGALYFYPLGYVSASLLYVYLLFGLFCSGAIAAPSNGLRHNMSGSYLLALPIKRSQIYDVILFLITLWHQLILPEELKLKVMVRHGDQWCTSKMYQGHLLLG